MTKLEQMQERARKVWIEKPENQSSSLVLDSLITEVWNEAIKECEGEVLKDVRGNIFARCCDLRNEIGRQEDEHGIRNDATANRLSEAERMYAMFSPTKTDKQADITSDQ